MKFLIFCDMFIFDKLTCTIRIKIKIRVGVIIIFLRVERTYDRYRYYKVV